MTTLVINPSRPLRGETSLPGDKSLSHRAAILGALATGESRIEHFLSAGVTQVMLDALSQLGVDWHLENDTLLISGRGWEGLVAPKSPIWCGNSATTLRLLAGLAGGAGLAVELTGSAGLNRRPMQRLVEPLQQMGILITATEQGTAPIRLSPRPEGTLLRAVDYRLPVASAQLKSAILLAALAGDGTTTVHEPGPGRDHTERMLRAMGVDIRSTQEGEGSRVSLTPPKRLSIPALGLALPGDFSAAAFLIVAALITPGSEIVLHRVGLNPTRTGLLETLQEMGADIQVLEPGIEGGEPVGDLVVRASRLSGTTVSGSRVVRMIDEFPIFAVAAAYAQGKTVVSQADELRHKESDRIGALCEGLAVLGVPLTETPDGFVVSGGTQPTGGTVVACGDHRLAMSFAVAGLAAMRPVSVAGAEMLHESFPGFVEALTGLGADIQEEEEAGSR